MDTRTQREKVIEWLETRGALTALEALTELGIARLAARIEEIRRERPVNRRMIRVRNRYGSWVMVAEYSFPKAESAPADTETGQFGLILEGDIQGPKGG